MIVLIQYTNLLNLSWRKKKCLFFEKYGAFMRSGQILTRVHKCTDWSEWSLDAHGEHFLTLRGTYVKRNAKIQIWTKFKYDKGISEPLLFAHRKKTLIFLIHILLKVKKKKKKKKIRIIYACTYWFDSSCLLTCPVPLYLTSHSLLLI